MRLVPCTLGLLTLAVAWSGVAGHSFSAHMSVHMAVVAVAAPLLAIGIAESRWDPVRRSPVLFSAIIASLVELAIVWVWHTPLLHAAARQNVLVLAAEQSSFLLSGLFLWISAFGGDPQLRRARGATGIAALLLTVMHMTLLGALLALAPRPLYEHAHAHGGLSALDDQHLGGAIMLVVGGVSYLAGGLWLSFELLRPSTQRV
jgi:putative membrane protein